MPDEFAPLLRFLEERGICDAARAHAEAIGDGHSNLTYLVGDGERRVVIRRPPPGGGGGYDVQREARLLRGLADSEVPVPRILARSDGGVLDSPFLVMSFIEGVVVTTRTPPPLDGPRIRQRISRSLVDVLAAIHRAHWQGTGLRAGSEQFNARHLARVRTIAAGGAGDVPADFGPVDRWLASRIPPDAGTVLLHNDYRLGNLMIDRGETPGAIAAVLDWELAAIGDPLFDLAYLVGSLPGSHVPATPTREMTAAMLEEGYFDRHEIMDAYATASGRDPGDLAWHLVFAQFKLAALYEYSRRRVSGDPRGDDHFRDRRRVEQFLVAAGAEIPG